MKTDQYLIDFYSHYDEDSRLSPKHGMVEFLTTMRYVEKYIKPGDRVIEIGAGTGRYSHALARRGYAVDAVELVEHNIEIFRENTLPGETVTVTQGNALDLSAFPDKEYDITKGTPRSEILYMTVNPNGEAEVLKVYFKPRPRLKKVIVDLDFSTLAIKGRQSQGNLFSRYGIHKIVMKERGTSTLGSQEIWFDDDVHRLNTEGRGYALGAFKGEDKLLVWTPRTYYITGYDLQQHFPDDTVLVERYRPERVYAVCYFDREQNYYYLKRFPIESSDKTQFFLDEEGTGDFVCRTGRAGAQLEVTYAGAQASRPAERIEVDGFVGVKSHRAKGKRVTTFEVASLHFVEPEEPEEEPADPAAGDDRSGDAPAGGPPVATGAAAANEVGAASGIELPEGPAAVPPQTDDVEFTIERPRGDQDDVIDVEQLNLF